MRRREPHRIDTVIDYAVALAITVGVLLGALGASAFHRVPRLLFGGCARRACLEGVAGVWMLALA